MDLTNAEPQRAQLPKPRNVIHVNYNCANIYLRIERSKNGRRAGEKGELSRPSQSIGRENQ
eukprot:1130228-Pleurochrysis_carterae.AAC.2